MDAKQTAHILITDDSNGFRKTMAMILRRKGHRVSIADSGRQAIDRIKKQSFDMVFMDIKMPGMDGVEALKKIKEKRPGTVVIMMTAYAVDDLLLQSVAEGAEGLLHKPVNMEQVFQLIDERVGRIKPISIIGKQ